MSYRARCRHPRRSKSHAWFPPNNGAKQDAEQPTVLADGIEVFDVPSENFDRLMDQIVDLAADGVI